MVRVNVRALALIVLALEILSGLPARAAWIENGTSLAPTGGALIASDGDGGLLGCSGYPERYPTQYRLTASGDPVSGWPRDLTPGAILPVHETIAPIAIAADGAGGSYVLTAEQGPWPGNGGFLDPVRLYVHRRARDGSVARGWSEEGVLVETSWLDHRYEVRHLPTLLFDPGSGVLVTWLESDRSTTRDWPSPRLMGQWVTPSGRAMWGGEGLEIAHDVGASTLPALAADRIQGWFVFWGQQDAAGEPVRVIGQHLSSEGARLWGPSGIVVSRLALDPPGSGSSPGETPGIPATGKYGPNQFRARGGWNGVATVSAWGDHRIRVARSPWRPTAWAEPTSRGRIPRVAE